MTDNGERDLQAVEIAKLEGHMNKGFAELGGTGTTPILYFSENWLVSS